MAKTVGISEEELYAPVQWKDCGEKYEDIHYHKSEDGIAKITIARPQVRNAFRPQTVKEMIDALADARYDSGVGVIILTGLGEDAFCSGGDQKIRGDYGGYKDDQGTHHLNVLDFQRDIRTCPKPVIASVAGWAVGGGHVLHMMCDLTIAADNAQFGQTDPKVGSFDGGWGASYMARIVVPEESSRNLVPMSLLQCTRSSRYGTSEHSCATRRPRKRNRSLVS